MLLPKGLAIYKASQDEPTEHFYDKSVGTVAVKKHCHFCYQSTCLYGMQRPFHCCLFVPFHGIERGLAI